MPKKNIMFLNNELIEGGSEEVVFNLCKYIDKRKYNVYVAALHCGPVEEKFRIQQIKLLELPGKNVNEKLTEIKKAIYKLKIQLVFCSYLPRGHFIVPTGVHTVEIAHSPYPWLLGNNVYTGALKRCSRIVCVSQVVYQYLLKHYPLIKDKMIVIENGIDNQRLQVTISRSEVRKRYNLPEDAVVIGSISRICPEKGVGRIIEITRILNRQFENIFFVIAGDYHRQPYYFKEVEERIKQYQISNIIFTGFISDIANILQTFDIFIFPSSHDEGLQLALLEALKMGLPVVTTSKGVVSFDPKMIDGEIGFIVESCDVNVLSDRIAQLISNPERRELIGRNNKLIFSRNYLVEDMVKGYENLIQDLLPE